MGMDWIKYAKGLHETEEVVQVSIRSNIDVFGVVGRMLRIWEYIDTHYECPELAADADLSLCNGAVTVEALRRCVDHGTEIVHGMIDVGWIALTEDDHVVLRKWGRHNGESAKSRALCNLRVRKHRNAPRVTDALQGALPRAEQSREDKITEQSSAGAVNASPHCTAADTVPSKTVLFRALLTLGADNSMARIYCHKPITRHMLDEIHNARKGKKIDNPGGWLRTRLDDLGIR